MNNKPVIIAICGASSSGKSTFANFLSKNIEDSTVLVSTTTRPPRIGEVNGRDYNYITKNEFLSLLDKNGFLEYSKYKDWYYGTSWDEIWKKENDMLVLREETLIGVFNPEGLLALLCRKDLIVIPVLLEQPWYVRLYRSIKREGKFKWEYIRRLNADRKDFKKYKPLIIQRLHDNGDAIHHIFNRHNLKDLNWCVRQIKNSLAWVKCEIECNKAVYSFGKNSWQKAI